MIDQLDSFKTFLDFIHFPTSVPPYSPQPLTTLIKNLKYCDPLVGTPPIKHYTYQWHGFIGRFSAFGG